MQSESNIDENHEVNMSNPNAPIIVEDTKTEIESLPTDIDMRQGSTDLSYNLNKFSNQAQPQIYTDDQKDTEIIKGNEMMIFSELNFVGAVAIGDMVPNDQQAQAGVQVYPQYMQFNEYPGNNYVSS